MPLYDDISGKRFGRLVAIERRGPKWAFACDCGAEKEIFATSVKRGLTKSCGCLNAELSSARSRIQHRTHGMSSSTEFKIWQGMRQRCENPNDKDYAKYGGRGIRVCERWQKFEHFYEDMGARPSGLTLDRIDFDGDYEPGNCRWATLQQQNRNKRDNVIPGSLAAIIPTSTPEYQRVRRMLRSMRCH
jgi:hypothetical protein